MRSLTDNLSVWAAVTVVHVFGYVALTVLFA
jgi:hypothetical protein